MDRLRTEARRNRCGISIVAGVNIRVDDVLHTLSRRGLCHRGVPPVVKLRLTAGSMTEKAERCVR